MRKINVTHEPLPYAMNEEMKALRTSLFFCGDDKKVILLTSSLPGEGKSRTSYELAVSLAEVQKNVLLLDLDLRKSVMISRVSSGRVDKGMTNFLSGQCGLSDIVMATNIPHLHMAFSGPLVPNASELLSGEKFEKMMETLKGVYDYIIIDTPPLGLVVDSVVIARNCDGALIVAESGKTKYRLVQEVKRKLETSQCPILGVVLTGVSKRSRSKYYGKEYRHYGKEYKYESKED